MGSPFHCFPLVIGLVGALFAPVRSTSALWLVGVSITHPEKPLRQALGPVLLVSAYPQIRQSAPTSIIIRPVAGL